MVDRPLEGALSPPRRNGELAFDALWQSRIFGMTLSLHDAGVFAWNEFRDRLITAVAAREAAEFRYWECWLEAFEALLGDKGLCDASALAERVREFAARPTGHDHR